MSHWSTVKTAIKNKTGLLAALKELFPENQISENEIVRGYSGNRLRAEIVLKGKTGSYDIGFNNENGTYAMTTDWWGAKREFGNETDFTNGLNRCYAKSVAKAKAKKLGYMVKETENENGDIQLVLTKY